VDVRACAPCWRRGGGSIKDDGLVVTVRGIGVGLMIVEGAGLITISIPVSPPGRGAGVVEKRGVVRSGTRWWADGRKSGVDA